MHWPLWITVFLLGFFSSAAYGQTFCDERESLLNRLATEWGEELVEVEDFGLYGLLEVVRSPTRGTWTLLLTRPGKISCVVATGGGLRVDEYSLETTEHVL